jgi:hypothetical protein
LPPPDAPFAYGALEGAQAREQGARSQGGPARTTLVRHELDRRPSLAVAYELWLQSWEAALWALVTATKGRALSTNAAAAHRAVIVAERKLVTTQFTHLLGHDPTRRDEAYGITLIAIDGATRR